MLTDLIRIPDGGYNYRMFLIELICPQHETDVAGNILSGIRSVGNLFGIKHGFRLLHNTFPIFARFFTNSSFASQVIINLFCINVCTNNCFLRSTSFSL